MLAASAKGDLIRDADPGLAPAITPQNKYYPTVHSNHSTYLEPLVTLSHCVEATAMTSKSGILEQIKGLAA